MKPSETGILRSIIIPVPQEATITQFRLFQLVFTEGKTQVQHQIQEDYSGCAPPSGRLGVPIRIAYSQFVLYREKRDNTV